MHGFHRGRLASLGAGVLLLSAASCPSPQVRPGPAFEGSVHWAWAMAEPMMIAFASDAQLYTVNGVNVYHDGRLPSNTGAWGFVTWSPSRQEILQINVNSAGTASTEIRSRATAPGANGEPVPAGWVNSPVIFAAAEPQRPGGTRTAQLAVFNLSSYSTSGLWAINYAGSTNVFVRWDGTLVESP